MAFRIVKSGLWDAGYGRCQIARGPRRGPGLGALLPGANTSASASIQARGLSRVPAGSASLRLPCSAKLVSRVSQLRPRQERSGRELPRHAAMWFLLPVALAAGQAQASAEASAPTEPGMSSSSSSSSSMVFTTLGCPFCKRAKSTLREQGVAFEEVNVDSNPRLREALATETGRRTVPVVFVNGAYVGGADELDKAVSEGRLPELLKQPGGAEVPEQLRRLAAERPKAPQAGMESQQGKDRAAVRRLRLKQVAKMMARKEKGVPKQDAAAGWTTHRKAFSGAAAVEWFLKYLPDVLDSSEAVDLGLEMQEAQLLHHITFSEPFARDSAKLYRLHQDEPPARGSSALNDKCAWLEPARPASEVAESLRTKVLNLYESALSSDGRSVNYKGLAGTDVYNAYVEATGELQTVDLFALTRPEKLAFWLNIYNALVIHAMVEGGTPSGFLDRLFFYKRHKYHISGQDYSLDDIEHGVLRGNKSPSLGFPPGSPCFKASDPRRFQCLVPLDPRIHFALNCGAKSCPPIKVYESGTLDEALSSAAAAFCEGEVEVREADGTVTLSKILDWYKGDFGSSEGDRLRWLLPYVDGTKKEEILRLLEAGQYRIEFRAYDWGVND